MIPRRDLKRFVQQGPKRVDQQRIDAMNEHNDLLKYIETGKILKKALPNAVKKDIPNWLINEKQQRGINGKL